MANNKNINDIDIPSKKLDILINEHNLVSKRIQDMDLQSDKIITGSIAVITFAVMYGYLQNSEYSNYILMASPVLLLMVYCYSLFLYSNIFALGSYQRFIEKRINTTFDENILLWEHYIAKRKLINNIERIFLQILYFIIFIIDIFIGISSCSHLSVKWIKSIYIIGLLIFSVLYFIIFYYVSFVRSRSYKFFTNACKKDT